MERIYWMEIPRRNHGLIDLSTVGEILSQHPDYITDVTKYLQRSKHFTSDTIYWDKIYQRNNRDVAWYTEHPCKLLLELTKTYRSVRILEIGSGFGTNAVALAQLGNQVTAVEIAEEAIKLSEQLAKKHNVYVNFVEGNFGIDDLNLKDFDLVIDRCVFHADPKNFVSAVRQSLKQKGRWISIVHSGPKTDEWGIIPSLTVEQLIERVDPLFKIESILRNQIEINRISIPVLVVQATARD